MISADIHRAGLKIHEGIAVFAFGSACFTFTHSINPISPPNKGE
ncbi:hypothetical protein HOR11_gp054 [Lactobacillus phage SA-C12]|uniref:Uncharacterized protein n=1 Tax=Lactobacillus phage SA-C12 TaxID=1755697 RepID=A0A1I9KK83_9CAUD|nr:hypothetical protein HOR11_gp054 [Lactobacillus phage SA-C12]ALY06875.1 hypothetical protein SAC12_054 [Lactobacillus phage SA-C12]